MLKNYFKIAIRILMRNKIYSLINIAGLATGLAACMLILLYIQYEVSYDRYNKNADRIFRITEHKQASEKLDYATSPEPLGPVLKLSFPEIENTVRMVQMSHYLSAYDNLMVSFKSKQFYEQNLYFTDPSFFRIFTIPILKGDAKNGLANPYTIFISASVARKYFGPDINQNNPIGKTLKIGNSQDYTVTGVFKDFPPNSHIHADFLASFSSLTSAEKNPEWDYDVFTYALLKNKSDAARIEDQFPAFVKEYIPSSQDKKVSLTLMPLLNIHLHSNLRFEAELQGDIKYIYLFSGIALLILLIACFNYINMATARSAKRALETGVRKVLGANRGQLIKQYFFESLLLNLFALTLAIALSKLLLPYFNRFTQLQISFSSANSLWICTLLAGVLCSVSLLSGLYPALLLSSYRPVLALKGKIISNSGIGLRRGLVIFQFAISVMLIICAIVLQMQMTYIQNHHPGTKDSQVILIRDRGNLLKSYGSFKSELLHNPQIQNVTTTQFIPGFVNDETSFGLNDIEGFHEKLSDIPVFYGDVDFVNTLGLKMLEGRNFSKDYPSDTQQSILINEEAAKRIGWKDPVGKYIWFNEMNLVNGKLSSSRKKKMVIGVVANFHYESLKKIVSPAIIEPTNEPLLYIAVEAGNKNIAQTLLFIQKEWRIFVPEAGSLDYTFLKDDYAAMYRPDYLLENIFKDFALLAIIIACLGLFGLVAFSAEQRTKEIGIRKVLGASVGNIMSMLSGEFLKLVIIAIIMGMPVGWWMINKWLQNYIYRVQVSWWIFLAAGVIAILIALIAVSFQAIKAAVANPVESLRSE